MNRYSVTLASGGSMKLGPFRGNFQWQGSVDAPDPEEAVAKARKVAHEKGFVGYDRRVRVEQVHSYAITLRGKTDKRRREKFFETGTSEKQAIHHLGFEVAATRFAGYGKMLIANVVKVEVLP